MKAAAAFEQDGGSAAESTPLVGSKAAATNGSNGSCSSAALVERYSHPLVVPSDTAFKALLIAPLVVWWVSVLAGAWVYEGLPKGQKVYHVMMWFDKGLLRPAGPLVPFVVVLLRALVHFGEHHWQLRSAAGTAAGAGRRKQAASMRLGSLLLSCLAVYSAMAVARLAIYLTHYFLLSQRCAGLTRLGKLSTQLVLAWETRCSSAAPVLFQGSYTLAVVQLRLLPAHGCAAHACVSH